VTTESRECEDVVDQLAHLLGVGADDFEDPSSFVVERLGVVLEEDLGESREWLEEAPAGRARRSS